jgi:hypothetical protein
LIQMKNSQAGLSRTQHSASGPQFAVLAIILLITISCSGGRAPAVIDEVAHYDTPGWAHDVAIDDDSLYVSDRQGGYLIFHRASGWAAPNISAPVKDVISLAPHSGSPLLASRYEGLVLIAPAGQVVARLANGDIANAAVTRGELAFAAFGSHGLVIARIGQAQLSLLSELSTPGWSHDVKLWDDRALLADWNYGLRVVDVSRPERPVEIGVLPTAATSICISLGSWNHQTIAAVAQGHGGVSLVAFDHAGHPSLLGHHPLGLNPSDKPHPEAGGWAHGVALCANHLFVADWKRGLAILDVQDPRHPRLLRELPTRGTSLGVKAEMEPDGRILIYLADGEEGLRILRFDPRGWR